MREQILEYSKKKYKAAPEHLWNSFPNYVVLRHNDNSKWFAVIMDVPREKLDLSGEERIDILNVKLEDPLLVNILTQQPGYLRGYHMSRGSWLSILLDGTVPFEEIKELIDMSFFATASKQRKKRRNLCHRNDSSVKSEIL